VLCGYGPLFLIPALDLNRIAETESKLNSYNSSLSEQQESLKYLRSINPARILLLHSIECVALGPVITFFTYDLLEHGLQSTAYLLIPKYKDAVEMDSHYRHCSRFNEGDWGLRHLAARASEFLFAWGICLAWSAFRNFHRRRVKLRALAAGIAIMLLGLRVPGLYNNWLYYLFF
jgi:hypothetical protein